MEQNQGKKILKYSIIGVLLASAALVAMNSYTIVSDGSVKVGTFLGKVDSKAYPPGLNFPVNPLMSFETYSTKDIRVPLKGLLVPSQDKMKSSVDVTVMLQFDGNKAPTLKINGGSETEALDKYVRQKLISTILEFGKNVPEAQSLFTADTQRQLQDSIREAIQQYSSPYGYTIKEIMIQDITLPDVVQKQVVNTKIRQEEINQAKAEAEKEKQLAQKKVEQANADREVREQLSKSMERDADAKLYSAQKEAEANAALQRTITTEMIRWKELDVEMIKAGKYKGDVPQTVIGAGYDGKLILDTRNMK